MYIASFDIGKRNFAFCIEEVDVEKLKKLGNIPKTKRFNPDNSCTEEYQKLISSVYTTGDVIMSKNIDLTTDTEKSKYLDKQIFINMYNELDKYPFEICDIIIIEQQMSFGKMTNTMALKLGQHCYSYFIYKFRKEKEIIEFPAFYKTQILGAPKKLDKPNRKKWSVDKAISILSERGDVETLDNIIDENKRDDLADVFNQLQSFKYLRFIDGCL